MEKVKKLVEDLDEKKMKEKFVDTTDIMKYVEAFIKKKKLIIYGGYAVNALLSKKSKFYKEYTINDFDCYSANAKQDAKELAAELAKHKIPYIKIRKALHENTYKVYANFLQVIDLTQISLEEFNGLKAVSEYEKNHTKLYKNYSDAFALAPVCYLKASMHFELARPVRSYFRWEKIFYRLELITQLYAFKKTKVITSDKAMNKTFRNVLKYIKTSKLPIVGQNACKFYGLLKSYVPYIVILCIEPQKVKEDIIEIMHNNDILTKKHDDFIIIEDKNIKIKIINIEEECFSCFKKGGYTIGSYDTILYYMYEEYLYSIMNGYLEYAAELYDYISLLEYHIQQSLNNDPLKRLKTECFGKYTSIKDILAKRWKKRQTLEYY
jgi:hypothetical protein